MPAQNKNRLFDVPKKISPVLKSCKTHPNANSIRYRSDPEGFAPRHIHVAHRKRPIEQQHLDYVRKFACCCEQFMWERGANKKRERERKSTSWNERIPVFITSGGKINVYVCFWKNGEEVERKCLSMASSPQNKRQMKTFRCENRLKCSGTLIQSEFSNEQNNGMVLRDWQCNWPNNSTTTFTNRFVYHAARSHRVIGWNAALL